MQLNSHSTQHRGGRRADGTADETPAPTVAAHGQGGRNTHAGKPHHGSRDGQGRQRRCRGHTGAEDTAHQGQGDITERAQRLSKGEHQDIAHKKLG